MIWWNFFKYSFTNNEIVYFFYLNKKVWMYINQLMRKWAGEFSRLAVQRSVTEIFFFRHERGEGTQHGESDQTLVPRTGGRDEKDILVSDIWRKWYLMKVISNVSDI